MILNLTETKWKKPEALCCMERMNGGRKMKILGKRHGLTGH